MPKTEAVIEIQNVVATGTLNQKVDLNAVVKGYPSVEYRPEQFPGLVFRLKRPKTATLRARYTKCQNIAQCKLKWQSIKEYT